MAVRNLVYGFLTIIIFMGAANIAGAQSASAAVKWVKKELVPVMKGEKPLEIKIKRKKPTSKSSEQISIQMKYTPENTLIADSKIYTTEY